MSGLVFLIPAALLLGGAGLAGFLWALRSGQFDDLDGAAVRILSDSLRNSESSHNERRGPLERHSATANPCRSVAYPPDRRSVAPPASAE
jgi:cbb3-type cytochrome oxidase maturation protein